mgnify:CR=1 FL=1
MTRTDGSNTSTIDVIGDTPLIELSRLTRGLDGRIFAKLEYLNPGFSKKDRIARQIIEDAEAGGGDGDGGESGTDELVHFDSSCSVERVAPVDVLMIRPFRGGRFLTSRQHQR